MASQLKNRTVTPDGEAIQRLRIEKGWRVEDLAKKSRCSLKTVENVERGRSVYLYTLSKFAQALGVEVSTLMAGAAPPDPPKKERVWKVIIQVSTPYEDFDESNDLVKLLQTLVSRLGGEEMEPNQVRKGSTRIEVEMTLEQMVKLIEAFIHNELDDLNIGSILLPDDLAATLTNYSGGGKGAWERRHQELLDKVQAYLRSKRKQTK
jgi:transcriptional regulator with XRE-family HTH domain